MSPVHSSRLLIVACAALLLVGSPAQAGQAESRILWVEGKPQVEVTLSAEQTPEAKVIPVPVELFDAQGARLWGGEVKVPLEGQGPWKAQLALPELKEPKKQHQVVLRLQHDSFKGDYREEIHFAQESAAIQTHGLRIWGIFPERKVFLTLGLNRMRGQDTRPIPVSLRVRDGEGNLARDTQSLLPPAQETRLHLLEVTPDTNNATGPFALEASIESEAHQLFFSTTLRFAQPNALVPFSGLEHGDPTLWFAASPNHRPNYQTGHYYYSPHLTDLRKAESPRIVPDREVKRSGRQSLRIDYPLDRESDVWSLQPLPGKPLALWLWVKGNASQDQLVVHFEDNSNFTLPAWQRFANFSSAVVCRLDFEGWKRFRVPVLGEGLQASGVKGSTEKVDAPVRILALTLKPAPGMKPPKDAQRSVWIDDLATETQVGTAELVSLEVQNDDPQGRLLAEETLGVAVGNGHSVTLKKGRITLTARDLKQNALWTRSIDLEVPAGELASITVPLRELAEKKPGGPLDLDVTFHDVSKPGIRVSRRLTLKAAQQEGVVHDFEEPMTFNGYQPGKVGKSGARIVRGGADGKGHALALEVKPKQEDNSVLFHPALPGMVDRIEMMVQGGDRPVSLQPWLIDSGYTGIWLRPYNLFSPPPIVVDWKGWKKVVVAAPPIPAHHGDRNRSFLFRPWYPLHLALNARTEEGETPVEIRIDDIRVVTHLPEEERLQAEVDYPDEARIHPPGTPLRLIVRNFGPEANLAVRFELRSYQGHVARTGTIEARIPAGAKQPVTLVDALPAGIFDLAVTTAGESGVKLSSCVMALDARRYFGDDPLEALADPLRLRRQLGLMTEKVYLDWDNFEAAPHLFHHQWFEEELKKVRALPILPKELVEVSRKNDEAQAAIKKADETLRNLRQQEVQALQALRSAEQKLAATEKLVPPARAEEEMLGKAAKLTLEKSTSADREHDQSKALAAEAMKALQTAELNLKTSQAALPVAEKEQQTIATSVKDAEMKGALAQAAAAAATKELIDTEAALKSAEGDPKKKDQVKPLQDRVAVLKKKQEAARNDVEVQKKLVEARKTEAERRRLLVETARKKIQTDTATAQAARQTHQQAMQKAMNAQRQADQAKRDATAASQRHQASAGRLANLVKMLEMDQKSLEEKRTATLKAREAIEKSEDGLEELRSEGEKASAEFEKARSPYVPRAIPVVGFCAEWAGPEAIEAMERGTYTRWIPNRLQMPRRLIDWSEFVRATQREHRGRFDSWVFWENPDLEDSPQSIPPRLYRPMLESYAKWVRLYSPRAKVVAGGFNFHRALDYLQRIEEPHTLPFDEFAVQMNLAELSPEQADLEGFLDELNDRLRIRETKRLVRPSELDWAIGKHLSPLQQAAYHARATLILASRGVPAHQFSLINTGFDFEGFGVFYRGSYGSSPEVQTHKPYHIPKPAYFALMETRRFLDEWKFVTSVHPPDRSLADNRAFLYRNSSGRLTAALWRTASGERIYRVPAGWQGAKARDIIGFEVALADGLRSSPLPTLVELPEGYPQAQLVHDIRMLETTDGSHGVVLDLHAAEEESAKRARYQATGKITQAVRGGALLGERKVRESYLEGIENESFSFDLNQAGNVLLRRRWYFDGEGSRLFVKLNDGPEQEWDLRKGQGNEKGLRETTWVLRDCKQGRNEVRIRHDKPGNGAGYRLERMPADHLPLARAGLINGRQTRGEILKHSSAVGTPLTLSGKVYEMGLGTHATAFLEYPLAGQFSSFEVTVGVDSVTEGRGSVLFRVFVDGKERASSGLMNGFSKPKVLKVDNLDGANRLILSVTDAGDGTRDDLANWVEGKLWLRKEQ